MSGYQPSGVTPYRESLAQIEAQLEEVKISLEPAVRLAGQNQDDGTLGPILHAATQKLEQIRQSCKKIEEDVARASASKTVSFANTPVAPSTQTGTGGSNISPFGQEYTGSFGGNFGYNPFSTSSGTGFGIFTGGAGFSSAVSRGSAVGTGSLGLTEFTPAIPGASTPAAGGVTGTGGGLPRSESGRSLRRRSDQGGDASTEAESAQRAKRLSITYDDDSAMTEATAATPGTAGDLANPSSAAASGGGAAPIPRLPAPSPDLAAFNDALPPNWDQVKDSAMGIASAFLNMVVADPPLSGVESVGIRGRIVRFIHDARTEIPNLWSFISNADKAATHISRGGKPSGEPGPCFFGVISRKGMWTQAPAQRTKSRCKNCSPDPSKEFCCHLKLVEGVYPGCIMVGKSIVNNHVDPSGNLPMLNNENKRWVLLRHSGQGDT